MKYVTQKTYIHMNMKLQCLPGVMKEAHSETKINK